MAGADRQLVEHRPGLVLFGPMPRVVCQMGLHPDSATRKAHWHAINSSTPTSSCATLTKVRIVWWLGRRVVAATTQARLLVRTMWCARAAAHNKTRAGHATSHGPPEADGSTPTACRRLWPHRSLEKRCAITTRSSCRAARSCFRVGFKMARRGPIKA